MHFCKKRIVLTSTRKGRGEKLTLFNDVNRYGTKQFHEGSSNSEVQWFLIMLGYWNFFSALLTSMVTFGSHQIQNNVFGSERQSLLRMALGDEKQTVFACAKQQLKYLHFFTHWKVVLRLDMGPWYKDICYYIAHQTACTWWHGMFYI